MTPTRARLEAAAFLRIAERMPAGEITPHVRAAVELAVRTTLDVAAEALSGQPAPHEPAEGEVDPAEYAEQAARRAAADGDAATACRPIAVPSPDGVPLLIDRASRRRDPG